MSTTQTQAVARRGVDGLAQIGATRFDVAGIRFLEGEGSGAGGGEGDGAGQQEQRQPNDGGAPWTKDNFDPERAYRLVENLRGDLAAQKEKTDAAIAAAAEKAQKETLAQFAKLLTGQQEPETDPAKLNEALNGLKSQLTEKDTALTQAQQTAKANAVAVQAAIFGAQLGANVPALLNNEAFKTSIASAEPTDEAAIKAAITKALQENAALKQPPARSGDVAPTGPTVQSLEAQLKAAEEKRDIAETIRLKRALAAARTAQQA